MAASSASRERVFRCTPAFHLQAVNCERRASLDRPPGNGHALGAPGHVDLGWSNLRR